MIRRRTGQLECQKYHGWKESMKNTKDRASEGTFISSWATDDDNENKLVISNGLYSVLTTKSVCVSSILN